MRFERRPISMFEETRAWAVGISRETLVGVEISERPPYDIGERTFRFACAIVTFCSALESRGTTSRHVAWQLLRCGTSVGANVQEARAPASRKDFSSKTGIALRECRETHFWLRVIDACALAPTDDVCPLREESGELIAILTAMVKKTR